MSPKIILLKNSFVSRFVKTDKNHVYINALTVQWESMGKSILESLKAEKCSTYFLLKLLYEFIRTKMCAVCAVMLPKSF